MTVHRLLLPILLLLLLVVFVSPLSAEPCHSKAGTKTTTGATETGRGLWRLLCDQVISRMDRMLVKSDEPTSGNRSKDGKVATTTTARPKAGSKNLAAVRSKAPLLAGKVTTTERTRLAHSGNKIYKDKKNLGTNRVIPSQMSTASPTTVKIHKDKKAPLLNVKVLRDTEVPSSAKVQESQVPSRQHKAFFVNYQMSQRVYQDKEAKAPATASTGGSSRKKHNKQKQKPSKQTQGGKDSDIYFIRLPPTPYSYVPGLGYISQPPSFSAASLGAAAGKRPQQHHKPRPPPPSPPQNPFIKLPIDFVSNGKPTSVYRWPPSGKDPQQQQHHHYDHNKHQHHNYHPHQKNKPNSPVIRLNRGPYVFDGRPTSVYVMKRNNRPSIPNLF